MTYNVFGGTLNPTLTNNINRVDISSHLYFVQFINTQHRNATGFLTLIGLLTVHHVYRIR